MGATSSRYPIDMNFGTDYFLFIRKNISCQISSESDNGNWSLPWESTTYIIVHLQYLSKLPNYQRNDFEAVDRALSSIGVSSDERMRVYRILAAILHLGNIIFEETSNGKCRIVADTRIHFENVARLLEIDVEILESALLTRKIEISTEKITYVTFSLALSIIIRRQK